MILQRVSRIIGDSFSPFPAMEKARRNRAANERCSVVESGFGIFKHRDRCTSFPEGMEENKVQYVGMKVQMVDSRRCNMVGVGVVLTKARRIFCMV